MKRMAFISTGLLVIAFTLFGCATMSSESGWIKLNGVQTVKLSNKKYKSGPFALQHGQGVIKFRKVQIRPL